MGEELDELVHEAREDSRAINALGEALVPPITAYVRRKMMPGLRRWEQSGDLVNVILLETLESIEGLPDEDAGDQLLRRMYRIANCRIIDALRKRRPVPPSVAGGSPGSLLHPPERGGEERSETVEAIRQLADALPPKYGEVVRLCGIDGLSYEEAGAKLSLTAEAVRKRYERAVERLRRRLIVQDDE